jgi:exopolyphosphatase/guanosine-5'-triphosphate,3'-diphosphate pyrophosphatase
VRPKLDADETEPGAAGQGARARSTRGRRPDPDTIAALDLGTNNCRLLVARPEGEGFVVIDAFSRAVRLGEHVGRSGELSAEAQVRAIKALRICAGKLRRHGVGNARIVATEACRRAANAAVFMRRVARELGLRTPPSRRVSLIRALAPAGRNGAEDANARAAAAHIADWISIPLGVSTLHERFAHIAAPRDRFSAMARAFEDELGPFVPFRAEDRDQLARRLQIIGVSGTATTFGALHLGLRSYDRSRVDGLWLARGAVEAVAERLLSPALERSGLPDYGPTRGAFMLAGGAILTTILAAWPVERMRVADRGLREGMLYGLLQGRRAAG